ncbi:hypothetical protein BGZ96_010844 [Linnemannia gamsii]|uniref:Uncharacterized protein n=1 Tax=Linnemannia gamsii TaxID=64522 RepID=A0ABQ7JTG5_9FUNG|nr:hypothetical protein BGZ96_010844 [Linnemannia gamsii]
MSTPFIRFARKLIIFLAFLDMILLPVTFSDTPIGELWWGTIMEFLLSFMIFVGYICSFLRSEKFNMVNRAFIALFPAVFLLGLKFADIEYLIQIDYNLMDCYTDSLCHAFNAETIFSVILGFMVVFEIYATLRLAGQGAISEQQAARDIENQRGPVTQIPITTFDNHAGSSIVHPDTLPGQDDPKKP